MDSGTDQIKHSAASCLGCITVSSIQTNLPLILQGIDKRVHTYYYLLALDELILRLSNSAEGSQTLSTISSQVWTTLVECMKVESEEGTKSLLCDCAGRFAISIPETLMPLLEGLASLVSPAPLRNMAVSAYRYVLSNSPSDGEECSNLYDSLIHSTLSTSCAFWEILTVCLQECFECLARCSCIPSLP